MIAVTGPTSGIGKAIAEKFARNGYNLLLIGRNTPKLNSLKEELLELASTDIVIEIVLLDLMDSSKIAKIFEDNKALFSKLTCFINNAGLAKGLEPTFTLSSEVINEMIQVNLISLIELSKNIAPFFIENKQGHIINIGSTAGHQVYPNGNVYCATKHAVRAMTQGLRFDLIGTGVRVSEISPGMVNTNFSTVRLGDKDKADQVYAGMTPLTAEDIAESVYWVYNQPKHVNIEQMVIYPTDQASATVVHRRE